MLPARWSDRGGWGSEVEVGGRRSRVEGRGRPRGLTGPLLRDSTRGMRTRFWLFAAAVAAALAANLALVSTRIAQTAEDSTRSLLTLGASGVRAQLELVDLRASPRLAALSPDLIEAARSAADPSQASGRPDERALRAAAAALQPEPDLLVVAGPHGAAV